MSRPTAIVLAAALLLAGGLASAGAQVPPRPWGEAKAGLQLSCTPAEPITAGGALKLHLQLRNAGRAAVALGPAEGVVAWALIQQPADGPPRRFYSRLVRPAKVSKTWPAELAAGQRIDLGVIDLAESPAWPYELRRKLLTAYLRGQTPDALAEPDQTLAEALRAGELRGLFYMGIDRGDRRPLLLKSNVVTAAVAPPDFAALPEARRKQLAGELLALFDRDAFGGQAACQTAVAYGPAIVPALAKAADGNRPAYSRMWIATALGRIRDDRAAAKLVALLGDDTRGVAHCVAYYGPIQRSAKVDKAILDAAREGRDAKLTGFALMGYLAHRGEVPPGLLEAGLAADDPRVRATVAAALRGQASDFNVASCAKLLKDRNPRVRSAAAAALGAMGRATPAVVAALIDALADADDAGADAAVAAAVADATDAERAKICAALSALTGRAGRYDPAADARQKQAVIEGWIRWRRTTTRPGKR